LQQIIATRTIEKKKIKKKRCNNNNKNLKFKKKVFCDVNCKKTYKKFRRNAQRLKIFSFFVSIILFVCHTQNEIVL